MALDPFRQGMNQALGRTPKQEPTQKLPVLYSPFHIALGSLFGSFLGASVLYGLNCEKLYPGSAKSLWHYIGIGAVLTCMALGIVFFASVGLAMLGHDARIGMFVRVIVFCICFYFADRKHGSIVTKHKMNGGPTGNPWNAVGIGFLCGLCVGGPLALLMYLTGNL